MLVKPASSSFDFGGRTDSAMTGGGHSERFASSTSAAIAIAINRGSGAMQPPLEIPPSPPLSLASPLKLARVGSAQWFAQTLTGPMPAQFKLNGRYRVWSILIAYLIECAKLRKCYRDRGAGGADHCVRAGPAHLTIRDD